MAGPKSFAFYQLCRDGCLFLHHWGNFQNPSAASEKRQQHRHKPTAFLSGYGRYAVHLCLLFLCGMG
jgi:hypothetical protein